MRDNMYALVPPGSEKFVEVSTSDDASCARTDAGNVHCWGDGNNYLVHPTTPLTNIIQHLGQYH